MNSLFVLELFKGTGSVGKVLDILGIEHLSLDLEKKFNPDVCVNILEWDYTKIRTPDFIWASCPCETFSQLQYGFKGTKHQVRDFTTFEPMNEKGRIGDAVLDKTIEIIKYFQTKNKDLCWVIENPRGMMGKLERMKCYDKALTTYCNYGDDRWKPTNFFNNFSLELLPCCKLAIAKHKHLSVAHIPKNDRYKIPPDLIHEIFNQWLVIGLGY